MRDDQIRLADIQEQITYIEQDVQLGHESFIEDRHLQDSIALRIGYIGEALSKISKEFKERYPEIPWSKAASMRAKLFHDYFDIDIEIIWKTATEDIPSLQKIISKVQNKKS